MQRTIKLEEHYLQPPYKIEEEVKAYGDEQGRVGNVKADQTNWHIETNNKFNSIIEYFNENYPQHIIEELWGCTYRKGDFTQAHTHYGFDRAFVWFVDSSSTCSPLIFPDPEHPWMPPIHVITPEKGKIIVFSGMDLHYVPPQPHDYERVAISGNMRQKDFMSNEYIHDNITKSILNNVGS